MAELDGKAAFVTGGGRGIGRAIALALAGAGASVAVTGRNAANLEQVAAEIAARGGRALALPCDVADGRAVEQVRLAARPADGDAVQLVGLLVDQLVVRVAQAAPVETVGALGFFFGG